MITLQHTFPESTSRTQTQDITIEKLKEISSVSVNTGYVSVVSVVDDLVTLQFAGGSYSRRVQTGGTYTPSDSITYTKADELGLYSGMTSILYRYESGKWVYYATQAPPPKAGVTTYFNENGYVGYLSREVFEYDAFPHEWPSDPAPGDIHARSTMNWKAYYVGTLTRPASDTRTYRYYYQYTATIHYLEKSLNIVYKLDGELREAYQGWVLIGGELREIDNMKKLVDGELREC